jgi:glutathione S-transferase
MTHPETPKHLKLIGTTASRVMRNVWMLEELRTLCGVTYEHDPISFKDPALYASPYFELNPNARIPILVADGQPIYESLAINLYLAEVFPTSLSPKNAIQRGQAAQFALWALSEMELPVFDWAIHTYLDYPGSGTAKDPAVAAAALAKLQRPLKALSDHLKGKPYLLGQDFTVADLNTASVLYRLLREFDFTPFPGVADWMQRCWSREAAKIPRRARGEDI